jgi:hypothetical protein
MFNKWLCFQKSYQKVSGSVWGMRLGSDVSQTRHEENTSPKRSIWRRLGTLWGTRLEML